MKNQQGGWVIDFGGASPHDQRLLKKQIVLIQANPTAADLVNVDILDLLISILKRVVKRWPYAMNPKQGRSYYRLTVPQFAQVLKEVCRKVDHETKGLLN